ncbi:unnamed protein product [Phytophthora fragariaefolia]|uniref:Unnamed protein product n=1 Tax=Phytophthora fragariaefolia TaxID=1490495 RepID=A0A9W6XZK6_9STRA|nr:unnamed protein product [Phytophthora fragariaefolia]
MSICPMNEIAEFWSDRRFLGQFAEFAVPVGVSIIDEMTVRTKAWTRAKANIPSKPDKYGVRFDAVVGWSSLYVYSVWDNSSGNTMPFTPVERYTSLFSTLRTAPHSTLRAEAVDIGHDSATALWNKPEVAAAIIRVDAGKRGGWERNAAVDPEPGWQKKQVANQNTQCRIAKAKQTTFDPVISQAEKAGYIVYNNRKVVIFYTNDLKATSSARVLPSTSPEAVLCCDRTFPFQRWTEDRMMHRKLFMVPAVIAAYNLCMNAVDRVNSVVQTQYGDARSALI